MLEMAMWKGSRQMEWISVEEKLPEPLINVLVTDGESVDIDWFMRSSQEFMHGGRNRWTHWMPLPKPPKEERK